MISIDLSGGRIWTLAVILAGFGVSGCSGDSDGFARIPVEGTVTLDGQPLKAGKILFNAQQQGASAFGDIAEGKFTLSGSDSLSPGPYRVEIYGIELTGRKVPSADDPAILIDETVDIVPKRYNIQSTLQANLLADGPKEPLVFELKSEEPKTKGAAKSRRR